MLHGLLRRRSLVIFAAASALGLAASAQSAFSQQADKDVVVRVGVTNSISDAPLFIADKLGYFAREHIKIQILPFTSATNMVAPLGAGQLDVGGGSASAALYNAVARGIKLKIVADKASSQPGYGANKILIAKQDVASGRYKTLADLKGMKIAMNGPGISNVATLSVALKKSGLSLSDVSTLDLPFPDHVVALQNNAVDASVTTEPSASIAVARGYAVVAATDDQIYPGHAIAQLLYSDEFAAKDRAAADGFMRAYLSAVRFYLGALANGRFDGPNSDKLISILTESTPIKNRAIFKMITPSGIDPNGRVSEASLREDYDIYKAEGLIKKDVDVSQVIDSSFVERALAQTAH